MVDSYQDQDENINPTINNIYLNQPGHRPILQHTRLRRTYTQDGQEIDPDLINWFNNNQEKEQRINIISLQFLKISKIFELEGEIKKLQETQDRLEYQSRLNLQYGEELVQQTEKRHNGELNVDDLYTEETKEDEIYQINEPQEIKTVYNQPITVYNYQYAVELSKKYPTFAKLESMIEQQQQQGETAKQKVEIIKSIIQEQKQLDKTQRQIYNSTQKVYNTLTDLEKTSEFIYKPKTQQEIMENTRRIYE